jgi:HD-like signal output (HDOD) protein/CheY-like chemotaxis protein
MSEASVTVPRVLIAETDPWTRDLLTQIILTVRCDAVLDICENGLQAVAKLSLHPDLVLASRELAGVDGLDVLRHARRALRDRPLPFILISNRSDTASVREALPLAPTAYLTKPLNVESLRQRLQTLLLSEGAEVFCGVPPLIPGMVLNRYLDMRREQSDGAPLLADVQVAVKRSLQAEGLNLKLLEEEVRTDPQITAVLIAAANSAAQHREGPAQTLLQAMSRLGATQSMNLILGLALKRAARLTDPQLAEHAEFYWNLSLHTAEYGRTLARLMNLEQERAYCAGLLHCLGDLAVLRCLQEWKLAHGDLTGEEIQASLKGYGAGFGSALRTRWRLPLELRELIAAIYQLGGGVYSRDALAMNLAAQMARLKPGDDLETIIKGKTARLLKISPTELQRMRRN